MLKRRFRFRWPQPKKSNAQQLITKAAHIKSSTLSKPRPWQEPANSSVPLQAGASPKRSQDPACLCPLHERANGPREVQTLADPHTACEGQPHG